MVQSRQDVHDHVSEKDKPGSDHRMWLLIQVETPSPSLAPLLEVGWEQEHRDDLGHVQMGSRVTF